MDVNTYIEELRRNIRDLQVRIDTEAAKRGVITEEWTAALADLEAKYEKQWSASQQRTKDLQALLDKRVEELQKYL